jgi:hypothetical protein
MLFSMIKHNLIIWMDTSGGDRNCARGAEICHIRADLVIRMLAGVSAADVARGDGGSRH